MILSLVIVPARANNSINGTIDGGTLTIKNATNDSIAAKVGDTVVTLQASLSGATLKYGDNTVTNPQTEYTWAVTRGNAVTISGDKMSIVKKGDATIQCTATMTGTYTPQAPDDDNPTQVTVTAVKTATATVTVTDPQGDFAAAIESIGFGGKNYPVSNGKVSVPKHNENEFASGTWSVNFKQGTEYTATASFNSNVLTITGSNDESAQITVTPVPVTVVLSDPTYPVISKDGTTQITATYNGTESNVAYAWYCDNILIARQTTKTLTWTPTSQTAANTHSFKCVVSYDPDNENNVVESATKDVTVEDATYSLHPSKEITIYLAKGATDDSLKKILLYPDKTGGMPVDDAAYTFSSSNTTKVSVSEDGTLTALAGGEVTITVTAKDKNNSGATQGTGLHLEHSQGVCGEGYCR